MKLKERLDPSISALIVVDIQNDFCHPQGKRGNELSEIDSLVDRLSSFIEASREQGIPIIFIRTEHDKTVDSEAWLGRLGKNIDPDTYVPNCQPGSWGAEFYRLQPAEKDIVITKNKYSAFVGTNLHQVLQALKRRSLLFTGVATNICVESSLRDAVSHDYYATLVEDCCGTFSLEEHQSTIRNVEKQYGYVTASEEVYGFWKN